VIVKRRRTPLQPIAGATVVAKTAANAAAFLNFSNFLIAVKFLTVLFDRLKTPF